MLSTQEAVLILESLLSRIEGINPDLPEDARHMECMALAKDFQWLEEINDGGG